MKKADMFKETIIIKESITLPVETIDRTYTYDELLEIFDNDTNLVRPLVLRCREYEKQISELKAKLGNI